MDKYILDKLGIYLCILPRLVFLLIKQNYTIVSTRFGYFCFVFLDGLTNFLLYISILNSLTLSQLHISPKFCHCVGCIIHYLSL